MADHDRPIPLSVAHLSELDLAPARFIELAARAGLASVGLRTRPSAPGGVEYRLDEPAAQAEIRRLVDATGVSVLYIELISLSEATDLADCRRMLEVGAAIGATRLTVAGDSANFELVAERLGEVCDLAREHAIAVDLEFMPFRPVKTFADAAGIVRRAGRPNAHVLVDALHVFRSGSSLEEIAGADPTIIGTFQLCDAPAKAPSPDALVAEARTRRLLPGHGGLPLWPLIDVLPRHIPIGVEVPLASQRPDLDPAARLSLLVRSTREFLEHRSPA